MESSLDTPRIFDCFTFFNELELLEIRLEELAPVVDRFVIAESPLTFTGRPKPLHFRDKKARFAAFADKIIHIVADEQPITESPWDREWYQRNALQRGIADAAPDDLILLSDIDEIPRRQVICKIKKSPPDLNEVLCLELRMFYYFANLEFDDRWLRRGPRCLVKGGYFGMQKLRNIKGPHSSFFHDMSRAISAWRESGRLLRRRAIRDAGWHFSYLGGVAAIQEKVQSTSDGWKLPEDYKHAAAIMARVGNRIAVKDGPFSQLHLRAIDESFPAHLRANLERYHNLVASEATLASLRHESMIRSPAARVQTTDNG
jgi:beta-1,4-mannosyl-glycoprotein beta-1,4-N-acetylglucosaminyltransferase